MMVVRIKSLGERTSASAVRVVRVVRPPSESRVCAGPPYTIAVGALGHALDGHHRPRRLWTRSLSTSGPAG